MLFASTLVALIICSSILAASSFRFGACTSRVSTHVAKFRGIPTIRLMSEAEEASEVEEPRREIIQQPQVYVGNLPFAVDEVTLSQMISDKIGDRFRGVKIATDRNTGRSRGFGYITFEEAAAAENAVAELNGIEIEGRTIKFDISRPRDPNAPRRERQPREGGREPRQATNTENSLFVGNIDHAVTQEDMMMMCNEVLGEGKVTKIRLATDRETGRPRGFGHVEFVNQEEAIAAIDKLSAVDFGGRVLRVDRAYGQGERPKRENRENAVFIGNLDFGITDMLLKEMLDELIGPDSWENVRLSVDRETGRSRGFGHVDFKDKSLAEHAVNTLDGMDMMGRKIRVDFAGGERRPRPPSMPKEDSGSFGAW